MVGLVDVTASQRTGNPFIVALYGPFASLGVLARRSRWPIAGKTERVAYLHETRSLLRHLNAGFARARASAARYLHVPATRFKATDLFRRPETVPLSTVANIFIRGERSFFHTS